MPKNSNGATTTVAPRLFQELGFDAHCIGCEPDGRNINLKCGSTAPEALAKLVVDGKYALGIAFDGDGDRVILVDGRGRIVDGDGVMLMLDPVTQLRRGETGAAAGLPDARGNESHPRRLLET